MELINTTKWPNGDLEATFRDENRQLGIRVTEEGLIMDAWEIDEDGSDHLVGTVGRMASEWWEYLTGTIRGDSKSWRTDHLSVPDHGKTES